MILPALLLSTLVLNPPKFVVHQGKNEGPKLRVVPLVTSHLVVNQKTGMLWATVPSRAPKYPNSIIEIDPATGKVVHNYAAGINAQGKPNEPGALGLADDGSTLYVGLNGFPCVRQIDLKTFSTIRDYTFGANNDFTAYEIAVRPGHPDNAIVSWNRVGLSGPTGPVLLTKGEIKSPPPMAYLGGSLAFVNEDTLFCVQPGESPPKISRCRVTDDAILVSSASSNLSRAGTNVLRAFGDRIYLTSGAAIFAFSPTVVKTYQTYACYGCAVNLDKKVVFFSEFDGPAIHVEAYEMESCKLIRKLDVSGYDLAVGDPWWNIDFQRVGKDSLVYRSSYALFFIDHAPGL